LPTIADDVYSNNFNVTIDQNVSINYLSNYNATNVTAGGKFIVDDNDDYTISITTDMVCYNNLVLLELTANCVDNEINLNFVACYGGLSAWNIACYSTGTVNINGNMWSNSYTTGSLYIYNG